MLNSLCYYPPPTLHLPLHRQDALRSTTMSLYQRLLDALEEAKDRGFCQKESDILAGITAQVEEMVSEINTRDSKGCTGLMPMLQNKEHKPQTAYEVLHFPRIDVHAQSSEGWTALSILCRDEGRRGMLGIVRKLVELGADVAVRHTMGETLVMLAVLSGTTEVLSYLLSRRFDGMIDLEAKDTNGHTALMLACKGGPDTLAAVELLLQSGADPRKNETTCHCPLGLISGEEAQKKKKKSLLLAARAEPERARQLHKIRYMLERMPEAERRTTTTSIEMKETIITTITTMIVTPEPVVTVGAWEEEEEEGGVRRGRGGGEGGGGRKTGGRG